MPQNDEPNALQEFGDSARARKLYAAESDDDDEEEELEPNPKLAAGKLLLLLLRRTKLELVTFDFFVVVWLNPTFDGVFLPLNLMGGG